MVKLHEISKTGTLVKFGIQQWEAIKLINELKMIENC